MHARRTKYYVSTFGYRDGVTAFGIAHHEDGLLQCGGVRKFKRLCVLEERFIFHTQQRADQRKKGESINNSKLIQVIREKKKHDA